MCFFYFFQEPEAKIENQESERLPSLQETALQTDKGTEIDHVVTEVTVEAQEPPLAMTEEMLLEHHTRSDIAESELWEAQWSDVNTIRDDIQVDIQTSESTVSDGV